MNEPALQWVWSRLISAKMADCWVERLEFLGRERLVLHRLAGRSTARLEAYLRDPSAGPELLARFGGRLRKSSSPLPAPSTPQPLRIGRKLWIVPEGVASPAGREECRAAPPRLIIPAGMAFGTGRHATTGMLLREMAALPDWSGSRLLDVGTGSGILALAARRLGASRIWALDNDSSALEVARRNEAANFPAAAIRWIEAGLSGWRGRGPFDRIVANLFLMPLLQGASRLAAWLAPRGILLVSGLLQEQAAEVETRFGEQGLRLRRRKRRGKWTMLRFEPALDCHPMEAPLP